MTDPFSVAGTAVGITSLGIQVCQGLIRYYSQFRSFHDDIDAITTRLEGLERILQALDTVKKKVELQDNEPSEQLRLAMQACTEAVKSLERMVKKCGETKLPDTLQDKARLAKKRLLWPFKKDTLMELKATLDGLQANLQLALQVLGIDVENRYFETIASSTNTLVLSTGRIDTRLNEQSTTLQSIQDGVCDISSNQRNQTSIMTSQMSTLSNQYVNLSVQLNTIEQHVTNLTSNLAQTQTNFTTAPRLLQESIHTYQKLDSPFQQNLSKYKNSISNFEQSVELDASSCMCRYRTRPRKRHAHWGFLSTDSRTVSNHLPTCPRFSHSDFSHTLEVRFKVCTRVFGFCVEAAFVYARKAGWTKIETPLRFRAVVSKDSPAFRPFQDASDILHGRAHPEGWKMTRTYLLDQVLSRVVDSFRQKLASPFDVLPDGESIFHKAWGLISILLLEKSIDAKSICAFFEALLTEGVPYNEMDDFGLIPSDLLFFHVFVDNTTGLHSDEKSVCSHLIRRTNAWPMWVMRSSRLGQQGSDFVAELLSVEHSKEEFEIENPLLGAVLARSLSELVHLLHIFEGNANRDLFQLQEALGLSISWPEGLRLLYSNSLDWIETFRIADMGLLDKAIRYGNTESITFLLRMEYPISRRTWQFACHFLHSSTRPVERGIFTYIANQMAKHNLSSLVLLPGQTEPFSPYHEIYLSPLSAECLWGAGFHDVDTPAQEHDWPVTPLWSHAFHRFLYSLSPKIDYELLEWFFNKGAKLDWFHPQYLVTPAHLISRSIAYKFIEKGQERQRQEKLSTQFFEDLFIRTALLVDQCDECVCPCSSGGCPVIACAVKKSLTLRIYYEPSAPTSDQKYYKPPRPVLDGIFGLVESEREGCPWMAMAILRVLTFDELGITHACCFHVDDESEDGWEKDFWTFPTEEQARQIHYTESKDIKLLETLMDGFEEQWQSYEGSFQEFVHTEWRTRMDEVCGEVSEIDEENVRRIEELGVVLEEPCGED